LSESAIQQAQLSLSFGGLGIRSLVRNPAPAFIAWHLLALPERLTPLSFTQHISFLLIFHGSARFSPPACASHRLFTLRLFARLLFGCIRSSITMPSYFSLLCLPLCLHLCSLL